MTFEPTPEQVTCPFCGGIASIHDLGRTGITESKLDTLTQHAQDGTIGEVLTIAASIYQRIDPNSTSLELSTTRILEENFRKSTQRDEKLFGEIRTIKEQITGTSGGDVAEMIVAEQLKQSFPEDNFERTKSVKAGTDVVAVVFDKKEEIQKISVSVKNTSSWNNSAIEQLEKNMKQDNANLGILVVKKLPKGANPTGHVTHNNGFMYCIVHQQYIVSVYAILRQLAIKLEQNQQYLDTQEKKYMQFGKVSKALAQWLTTDEHRNLMTELDKIDSSQGTIQDLIEKKINYELNFQKSANTELTKIHRSKLNACSFLVNLEELLHNPEGKLN